MILLIDNYDSFTYNLFQQIAGLGYDVRVERNDACTIEDIRAMRPEAIVLSPGPGIPKEAGITVSVVEELYQEFPILGICLGHQSIGQAFGAKIVRAQQIMHGKFSTLAIHEQHPLFQTCSAHPVVMRYHSLVIDRQTVGEQLDILATSEEDGEIMAIRHKQYPIYGVQFHPESIGTAEGTEMVAQFFKQLKKTATSF